MRKRRVRFNHRISMPPRSRSVGRWSSYISHGSDSSWSLDISLLLVLVHVSSLDSRPLIVYDVCNFYHVLKYARNVLYYSMSSSSSTASRLPI